MNNLFREVSNRVDRIFKSMIFAAAAGAAAIASLFFFSLAAFLLLQLWYGTLWASVIMGIVYALIALVALIAFCCSTRPRNQRRKRRRRPNLCGKTRSSFRRPCSLSNQCARAPFSPSPRSAHSWPVWC